MAERMTDMTELKKRTPSHARYPWNEWCDGSVWRVTKGKDFDDELDIEHFRSMLYVRASDNKMKVTTRKESDDQMLFQFISMTPKEIAAQKAKAKAKRS